MHAVAHRTVPARTAVVVFVAAVVAVAVPGPAAAADRTCTDEIGAETVSGNVNVPDGATCTLDATTVEGDIVIGSTAKVTVLSASVGGDVRDAGASEVSIFGSTVSGSISLSGGTVTIDSTIVGTDVQLESNSRSVEISGTRVDGSVVANRNVGGLTIADNEIGGDLQCESNDPPPTGGGNSIAGAAAGQCAGFADGGSPPDPPDRFEDVEPDSVHAEAIGWLADQGITEGCDPEGTRYCPGDPVTRAQMASFLDRALELADGSASFEDVPETSVHAPAISSLADAGITEGCNPEGTRYCPGDPVTRAQMASFLFRALAG